MVVETRRLTLRPFTPDDWQGFQALAIDQAASPAAKYEPHTSPTDEDGCKGAVQYFADSGQFLAVVLKGTQRIIGLLALNGVDENGQLDLGHAMHTEFQDNDLDREALEAAIGFAFATMDVASVVTRNVAAPDWTEQIAPLKSLGLTPIAADKPGELAISKQVWEARRR